MKKHFLYLTLLIIFFTSCHRAAINGDISYQTNEFTIPAVDQYADIYLTILNTDTLKQSLTILHLKEDVRKLERKIKYTKAGNEKDELNLILKEKKEILKAMTLTDELLRKLTLRAFDQLQDIKNDKKNTYYWFTDERGAYGGNVKAGTYTFIAISEVAKADNVLERRGKIFIQEITIKNDENTRMDVNFK